jgi:hypothetical protein
VNDYGRPQNDNDIAQQEEQVHKLIEQLNLLETLDRRITPEHVAERFRELLDDIGDDGLPAALRAAQAQAAEIVACARSEADVWVVKAELAASEADAANQTARMILADAGNYADTELQRAAGMVADARKKAEKIIAAAEKDAEEITTGAPAARGVKTPATHGGQEPQTAVMTAQRSGPQQLTAEEPTAAAKLTISLLPYQAGGAEEEAVLAGGPGGTGEKAAVTGKTSYFFTIIGGLAGAIGGIAMTLTHSIGDLAAFAVGELMLVGAVLATAWSRGLTHQGQRPLVNAGWKHSRERTQHDNCRNQ